MRLRAVMVLIGLLGSIAIAAPASAATAKKTYAPVTVKVGGHVCANTDVNAIADNDTILGTESCGKPEAFTITKAGRVTLYKLPAKDATYTFGSGISANGKILGLDGTATKTGPTTGYLLTTSGHLTALSDPAAKGHGTIVNSVNSKGQAVGYVCLVAKCAKTAPFIYSAGTFTKYTVKIAAARVIIPTIVTDSGQVDGEYVDRHKVSHGYQESPSGSVRVINAPSAGKKAYEGTYILGGASNGSVCGEVVGSNHGESGFYEIGHTGHVINVTPKGPKTYYTTDVFAINRHNVVGGMAAQPGHKTTVGFLIHA